MTSTTVRRRSERPALILSGFVAGALVAGLVVPFALGSRVADTSSLAAGTSAPGSLGAATGGLTQAAAAGSVAAATQAQTTGRTAAAQARQTAGGPRAQAGARAASAQLGVTDKDIVIGIPMPDIGKSAQKLGISSGGLGAAGDKGVWQAFIDYLNAKPIFGRKIRAIYTSYDLTDNADTLRACNELTEDHHVFAVLTLTFFGPAAPCVTVQHKTLLLNIDGQPDDVTRESQGRLFTEFISKNRILAIQALEMERAGLLKGKKIGVLAEQGGFDDVPVKETLLPLLHKLGRDPVHVTDYSADPATAQSQTPVEVTAMRNKGVQVIFSEVNVIGMSQFSQEADRQFWHPTYLTSDFACSDCDTLSSTYPDSFTGIGITAFRLGEQRTGRPEPATDARCRQIYEHASGKTYARGSGDYQTLVTTCGLVMNMLAPGLTGAGRTLTTTAFSTGLQHIGSFQLPYAARASYQPGKFDAPDQVRTVVFHSDCKCWVPKDEFRTARS